MFMFTEIDLQTFTRISLNMKFCFVQVLTGHTGSVLCLQYDDKVIISGSSDSTVRVWDVATGEMVNTLIHHCEAVLHLRFCNGMMVTCSKVIWLYSDFGIYVRIAFICLLKWFLASSLLKWLERWTVSGRTSQVWALASSW